VRFKRKKTDGFLIWTDDELAAYEKKWAIGSKERLVYALALYTGQRRSDVVRMGPQHVKGDQITVRQEKGGKTLEIPIHAELRKVLADA
jgi:integrase